MTEPEIDAAMRGALTSDNVIAISMVMMKSMEEDQALTFADFEKSLRRINSEIYLLALPVQAIPMTARIRPFDVRTHRPSKYWLWIELHGRDNARDVLADHDVPAAGNLDRLTETGLLLTVGKSKGGKHDRAG